jgi:hypothetical protein
MYVVRLHIQGARVTTNIIDPDMHQTQKCTAFPKNPLAVLPVKELLVKISYIKLKRSTCSYITSSKTDTTGQEGHQ